MPLDEAAAPGEDAAGQRVTAEVAGKVGALALLIERRFDRERVGDFLVQCVVTMFAEAALLLAPGAFTACVDAAIAALRQRRPSGFVEGLQALWRGMRGLGVVGELVGEREPIELELAELELLAAAAGASWRRVSPAIVGTLLERAMGPAEQRRHGAFYTPEGPMRRLVGWTIMEPLRAEWAVVRAQIEVRGRDGAEATARGLGHDFRRRLATVRVLDPACGSGNFLYVALQEMKRLEAEVVRMLATLGDALTWLDIPGEAVHPAQFHGIEIKPRAARVAAIVLWIGYLQWQVSAGRRGTGPGPICHDLFNIRTGDALITWAREEAVVDAGGGAVRRARGVTEKQGQRSRVGLTRLVGARVAAWPAVDFVVGNPPFLGNKKMRDVLGAGYVEAVRAAFPGVPGSADHAMYWWWRSADLLARAEIRRFGFVTTNTITQTFNRAVVEAALRDLGIALSHALPDHPWYDEGAQVRIAMTVAGRDAGAPAIHAVVVDEAPGRVHVHERTVQEIHGDLSTGARVRSALPLRANAGICSQGVTPLGDGFRLGEADLRRLGVRLPHPVVKPYLIGEYVMKRPRAEWIIALDGLSEAEARARYPRLLEHVRREVRPIREAQNDLLPRRRWWLFGRTRPGLRRALVGLPRYIATSRTSRHRVFVFVPADTLPDTKIVAIATADAAHLAVLSSRVHVAWALRAGGRLGVGNDPTYNHTEVFDRFPFPRQTGPHIATLRALGERLDAHRKARQVEQPGLTLTEIYRVLGRLRAGEALAAGEQRVRDQGQVDILAAIHDAIDRATLDAYGWPTDRSDEEIMGWLVELNARRWNDEQRGAIDWLRPAWGLDGG
ncbi:DNA methyltransferase [Nannocystis sp.]|uniref:DNA methyltransferase n=1 Tax=Nannocystis sp. TaxID=1962667 RepID=UPI0025FF9720|nr:DNA methyltransferase [Nannocystis sp.]MBK7825668.1 class I SAM-dependent DNA methyltransferase [Nannocystis sp.]